MVRVDVQDAAAAPWLKRFAFRLTPTFILLDGRGREIWRSLGSIDADRLAAVLRGL